MSNKYKTVMMKPYDHVATSLEYIPLGETVKATSQNKTFHVKLKDSIEFGHKFAVVPISKGSDVLKYGEVIGVATADIMKGEHVHVHNLVGKRARGDIDGDR